MIRNWRPNTLGTLCTPLRILFLHPLILFCFKNCHKRINVLTPWLPGHAPPAAGRYATASETGARSVVPPRHYATAALALEVKIVIPSLRSLSGVAGVSGIEVFIVCFLAPFS
ncbi:hypothetical protein AVEN_81893-1 [Araneus ventricosus]|uniref:Uncharacterized protein n=1 Tax=Araneus ventricosus TaxID=182803 RepID=A0A4Y2I3T5_ARAVE|nr:hypothetical protein AVEN_81893-1 [Araneus ventricosus]